MAEVTSSAFEHGGPDARGAAEHDFSTNANALGPCPQVQAEVQRADARHYPDPCYRALRERLADLHGVQPPRIHLAASGSEFIMRMNADMSRVVAASSPRCSASSMATVLLLQLSVAEVCACAVAMPAVARRRLAISLFMGLARWVERSESIPREGLNRPSSQRKLGSSASANP